MTIKTVHLSDGTQIPRIAFGTGTAFVRQPCKDACALALSLGFTHIDTAERYMNEQDVGLAIKGSKIARESLFITTKLGELSPGQTVEQGLRGSLDRLQLDYVDLYVIHAPFFHDNYEGGLKQVWREMVDLKKKGLTRSIGTSNFAVKHLEEIISLGLEKPIVNQIEYHIFVSGRLKGLIEYSEKHDIITVSWGCLTPLIPDRISDEKIAPICVKVKSVLDEIARKRGPAVTQNQVLFKWLWAKNIIAVTTSTKESRLLEYLETDSVKDLTQEEIEMIEQSTGGVHFRFLARGSYMDDN